MFKLLKWILKLVCAVLILALVVAAGLIGWLTISEYNPADREAVMAQTDAENLFDIDLGQTLTVFSWNIGYAGLDKNADFFMDGGKMVDPVSQQAVEKNMDAILEFMEQQDADAWLLQEVDVDSSRTEGMDQYEMLLDQWKGTGGLAYNYKCPFIPYPLPPLGQIESGIVTLTRLETDSEMTRVSLPCAFSWPIRLAQTKRCLLVTRLPIEGTDKELVLINLHLEAYDDGEGKIAQSNVMMEVLQEEYAKGNYVIAGGDFNQSFPGSRETYPITDTENWVPGTLEESSLPEGWRFAYDSSSPTCRSLDQPYDGTNQVYVIDGFILSPNVQLTSVQTVDLDFENSDHNPVRLQVVLN